MIRHCNACDATYNDFDCDTQCPHQRFAVSDTALKHLVEQGVMCPRCERHIEECQCREAFFTLTRRGQEAAGIKDTGLNSPLWRPLPIAIAIVAALMLGFIFS
jgi:hypothetical protein